MPGGKLDPVLRAAALEAWAVGRRAGLSLPELAEEVRSCGARLLLRKAARTSADRRLAAYHEAGHAVVSVSYKMHVDSVSIRGWDIPGSERLGHVELEAPACRDAIFAHLVVLFAGSAGECHFGVGDGTSGAQDAQKAYQLTGQLGWDEEERLAFLGFARAQARHLVRQHGAWVRAVADALLTYESLSGADVLQLRPADEHHDHHDDDAELLATPPH
jgi:hypothetical protein